MCYRKHWLGKYGTNVGQRILAQNLPIVPKKIEKPCIFEICFNRILDFCHYIKTKPVSRWSSISPTSRYFAKLQPYIWSFKHGMLGKGSFNNIGYRVKAPTKCMTKNDILFYFYIFIFFNLIFNCVFYILWPNNLKFALCLYQYIIFGTQNLHYV